jgi:hypothetical protein
MSPRPISALLLSLALALQAVGQDSKVDPKKKAPPEPKTWMCKKGELLWEEHFQGTELSKDWNKGKGLWQVDAGTLKSAEVPADNHSAYASRDVKEPNAIIQMTFKLEGAQWMGANFDGKGHVSSLSLNTDLFNIRKTSPGGPPTSKSVEGDSTRVKLNDGAWHTVVWEVYGTEMVATIDDKEMALAKIDGLLSDRTHLTLVTGGGQWAIFKDVKVWKAELDDKWPQKRVVVMSAMKKKASAIGY